MLRNSGGLFQRLVGLIDRPRVSQGVPNAEALRGQLNRLSLDFNGKVDALVKGFSEGRVTLGQFDGAMRSLIKQQHLAASVVGQGGTQNANAQTLLQAQRNINTQMGYFDKWIAEMQSGNIPTPDAMAARAKLYGKAATATANEANVEARGLPRLDQYPGDGNTQCLSNCRCTLRILSLDVVNANYDIYWQLGAAEHCPDCVAMSRKWNPLRVRHGQIVG